jgi:hypothetical protein
MMWEVTSVENLLEGAGKNRNEKEYINSRTLSRLSSLFFNLVSHPSHYKWQEKLSVSIWAQHTRMFSLHLS